MKANAKQCNNQDAAAILGGHMSCVTSYSQLDKIHWSVVENSKISLDKQSQLNKLIHNIHSNKYEYQILSLWS